MKYKGARIQVLDLPGIIEGAADGRGRGHQVISTARTCNLILIVLDAAKPLTHKKIIEAKLFGFGIRINQTPPNVKVIKTENGGIGYVPSTNTYVHTYYNSNISNSFSHPILLLQQQSYYLSISIYLYIRIFVFF